MAMEAPKNEGGAHSQTTPIRSEEEAKNDQGSSTTHRTHAKPSAKKVKNNVRKLRMERMMSKAELARRAGLSTLTVDRVERGMSCRMDTKRKILEALGLKPQDRVMVFGDAPNEDD
jgi:DNA-binding XRE family transcriptional regulator